MESEVMEQPTVETIETVETSLEVHPPQSEVHPPELSRSQRINALTGKAREHYRLTGNIDAAEALNTSSQQPAASEEAETAPASGPGKQKQEQPPKTKQDRNFRSLSEKATQLERENIAFKAKLEMYEERERAASRPSAPTAPSKEEPKQVPSTFPVQPALDDVKYQVPDGIRLHTADSAKWAVDVAEWVKHTINQALEQRLSTADQARAAQQFNEKWTAQVSEAQSAYKDYDEVVTHNTTTPLSYATLQVIQGLPDGAKRGYALAKNLELATKLADLTHIPGENQFPKIQDFMQWVRSDPDRAQLYGEKIATAKAELAKLSIGQKPVTPPKPLKEVIRSTSTPSAEVNTETSAAAVQDPIAAALKRGDFQTYKRLKNEQDLAARRLR